MVKAWAVLREELADWRVWAKRAQKFDMALANIKEYCFDSLLLNYFAVYEWHAVSLSVQGDCSVKVFYCDTDVVDCFKHLLEDNPSAQPSSLRITDE